MIFKANVRGVCFELLIKAYFYGIYDAHARIDKTIYLVII